MSSPESRPVELPTSRWMLLVVLVFVMFHTWGLRQIYQPNTWLVADGSFYFTTLRAIVEHGRLEQRDLQPQSWYVLNLPWNHELTDDWSNVALGRDEGWYPKHSILLPLLSIPLYVIFGVIGTLMTNVLLNLVFVLLAFLLARRFVRIELATLIGCLIAAQPFVIALSYSFSNDVLTADLLLGTLELVFAGRLAWAGLLAGISVWSRITNVVFFPAFALIALDQGGWKAVSRSFLFTLIPIGLYGAFNTWLFGAPWITSYQRVLVREHGVQTIASHARLFGVPWREGLHRVVLGQTAVADLLGGNGLQANVIGGDDITSVFPLIIPGVAGLLMVAWRRRVVALGLLLFMVLPVLVFAKYQWYRPHFLYPLCGASAIGIAAIFGAIPWFRVREQPLEPIPSLRTLAIAASLLLIGAVGATAWRIHHAPAKELLSSHIHEALVSLGAVPCDYWNPQTDRWECSFFDQGGQAMTGLMMEPGHVHGQPTTGIWVTPGVGEDWRYVRFPRLPGKAGEITFMLDDTSAAGPVNIEVHPRGPMSARVTLSNPGEQVNVPIDIQDGPGPALEFRISSPTAGARFLIVEGKIHA